MKTGSEAGFTLLEVIVVLAIVGLLFGLALPELGAATERMRLYAGVRQVVAMLNYARETAIVEDDAHTVEIDFERGRLALGTSHPASATNISGAAGEGQTGAEGAGSGAGGGTGRTGVVLPEELKLSVSGSGPDTEGTGEALKFFPDGTSNGIQLVITDRRGNRFLIEVSSVTGRIQARKDEAR
ncbi:MAG: Tfp pilus assembly protein FimT/FimU [Syntrophothermus sp.]